MISKNMRIHAMRELRANGISLHLFDDKGHQLTVAKPVEMEAIEHGVYATPFLIICTEVAQQLMDELWNCGIRPTEGSGSAGSLAATERHLKDMKTLAFHALKVPRG